MPVPVATVAAANPEGRLVARPGERVTLGGGEEPLARVRPGTIANMACLAGATDPKCEPPVPAFRPGRGSLRSCGRYWVRTSDFLGVNEALYH